jgi:hypothetical protein
VFSVADTVSKANGGTFESNISIGGTLGVTGNVISPVTIGGTTPTLTIGDAGAEDTKIVFDGNAQDFHIGLDDSADSLTIGLGSTLGTTSHMVFDANGHITKPLQSACLVQVTTQMNNLIVGNTTIEFSNEIYDQNSDFNTSNYTFTAPITGKYLINFSLYALNLDAGANYIEPYINTSNRSYYTGTFDPDNGDGYDLNYKNFQGSVVADLDANDEAKIIVTQGGGNAQMDVATNSFISVTLIC